MQRATSVILYQPNLLCFSKSVVSPNAHKEIHHQQKRNVNKRQVEQKTEYTRQTAKSNLRRVQPTEIPNKHTLDCQDKSWKLLRLLETHKSICKQSQNHHPFSPTVTLLNLQHNAIVAQDSGRNTKWRGGRKAIQDQLVSVSQCKDGNKREWKRVRRKGERWRTYGVWRPSFLPLPSSPLFPLISHTWDHYSSWNQHPTKTLLSLISCLSLPPLPLLHPYVPISLSPVFLPPPSFLWSAYDVLPTQIYFLFIFLSLHLFINNNSFRITFTQNSTKVLYKCLNTL